MLHTTKIQTVKPILESEDGIHLTAYIKNRGDLDDIRSQIHDAIEAAEEHLAPVLSLNEMKKFLDPLTLFLRDSKRLKHFKQNIGIFRTKKSFRALSIPSHVETTCIVASSFHVKPLIKWMQLDREFLLLGVESGSASLYQGDLKSLRHIDTVPYPEFIYKATGTRMRGPEQIQEIMIWLNSWMMSRTHGSGSPLFIAGKDELTQPLFRNLRYDDIFSAPIWNSFSHSISVEIASRIQTLLKADAQKDFEKSLVEFHYAVDSNQAKGNVFTIAKAAVQGRIKKLLIADSIQIFGHLDRESGEVKLNGRDLDHEDDDILDDIAQTVLAHGGQVTVAGRNEIPNGRPILAIMNDQLFPNELKQEKIQESRAL